MSDTSKNPRAKQSSSVIRVSIILHTAWIFGASRLKSTTNTNLLHPTPIDALNIVYYSDTPPPIYELLNLSPFRYTPLNNAQSPTKFSYRTYNTEYIASPPPQNWKNTMTTIRMITVDILHNLEIILCARRILYKSHATNPIIQPQEITLRIGYQRPKFYNLRTKLDEQEHRATY